MSEAKKISEDLLKLIVDEDFKNLSQKLNVYCPFKALSVANKEIRHSNFLADIITPSNPHGFDDHILRSLSQALLVAANKPELALKLHLSDLTNTEVEREFSLGSRKLDILIRFPKFCQNKDLIITIEVKVNSKEHDGQLKKYRESVNNKFSDAEKIFIYLTLEGDPPDTDDKAYWNPVCFDDIISVIGNTVKEGRGVEFARKMSESYVDMMKREHLEDLETQEMAANLWGKYPRTLKILCQRKNTEKTEDEKIEALFKNKHRTAIDYLKQNDSTQTQKLIKEFRNKDFINRVNQTLNKVDKGINIEAIDSRSRIGVGFKIREWEQDYISPEMFQYRYAISLYISFKNNECRLRVTLLPGNIDVRRELYDVFFASKLLTREKAEITDKWTRLYSKAIRNKDQLLKTIMDEKVEELKEDIIKEIKEIIPKFNEALKAAYKAGKIKKNKSKSFEMTDKMD